jgi:hypothetical protein
MIDRFISLMLFLDQFLDLEMHKTNRVQQASSVIALAWRYHKVCFVGLHFLDSTFVSHHS